MLGTRIRTSLGAVALLLVAATAACGTTAPVTSIGQDPPALKVGADIPYVPFAFGDGPDYKGMDMDLVREIGRRLGRRVEIQKTPFDTIVRDVAQGRFDMIAASMVITEERKKVVDFSLPYFNSDQSIMVKKGSLITDAAGLTDKRIGVVLGGTGEKWAKANVASVDLRTYDLVDDAFKGLAAGQLDAVINDFPSSKFAERSYPTLEVAATIQTGEYYGLAFKQGSPLRKEVDQALREMKADGTFERIYREWFQTAPPANLLS
ncbi:ABC transporter substrate-binding protein [Catellatospora sp. KI3]|uniref:ABC transporter substrate-binding protein n=1 Tax=Catellatospora sp. KI3 TaxID=3041620 RepID=UPI002482F3AA|nr:ABC transporter substrate-binding protein [Catellatospora sp. KI3]MDI1464369.1 ABC transporter substrate-binding protein [Catellatospora sp. KI3]